MEARRNTFKIIFGIYNRLQVDYNEYKCQILSSIYPYILHRHYNLYVYRTRTEAHAETASAAHSVERWSSICSKTTVYILVENKSLRVKGSIQEIVAQSNMANPNDARGNLF